MSDVATLRAGLKTSVLVFALFVPSQSSANENVRDASPDHQQAAELVAQLANPSFLLRERATKKLSTMGLAARPALTEALRSPDAEVRRRARAALEVVLEADFQSRLEAFAVDFDGRGEHELPAWQRFKSLVGSDRQARALFVEMQRCEPGLLEALESGVKPAAEVFAQRCEAIEEFLESNLSSNDSAVPLGSVAALLLVGSTPGVIVDEQVGVHVDGFVHLSDFQEVARTGTTAPLLKKLLGAWISKNNGASIDLQNLMLACSFDLTEGLPLAERMLENDGGQPFVRQCAILAIGRFGNREHVKLLEPFVKDETPCAVQQNADLLQPQIRDVALAACVHLTGQDLKGYGFKPTQFNQLILYQPGSIGFSNIFQRELALQKWKQWSASQQPSDAKH